MPTSTSRRQTKKQPTKATVTPLPPRLRREDSFFGLHFDFHAGADCTEVGKGTKAEILERLLELVKPDYVQCDCKGHPGLASYPTKVGTPAPGFVRDPLRIWRDVTARYGVALYMHFSGVFDTAAIKQHPEWARINEKGEVDLDNTSVFGPYVDELLIPQLKELRDEYDVDGVWLDGDCWASSQDYGAKVMRDFRRATGIKKVPRTPEEPYFFEWTQFNREGFRQYLRHYVDALHQHDPKFQIASNWAFSSFMPEPITADVDFLSGDYTMQNSVNSARFEGRCMASQSRGPHSKPWDLMAWSFASLWEEKAVNELGVVMPGFSTKSAIQLQQEAAVVLALGGGFQAYFTQKRDASITEWHFGLMEEIAKFCRARQPFCHRAEAVPQVALLHSGASFYRKAYRLFGAWGGELVQLNGILRALLETQNSVEVLSEHNLTGRLGEYPLVILPETDFLEPEFKDELRQYVRNGGNLLLIGPKSAALFEKELGIKLVGEYSEKIQWLEQDGHLAAMKSHSQKAKLGRNARAFGQMYPTNDFKPAGSPSSSITPFGKGKIAATYLNLGERFVNAPTSGAVRFLGAIVHELFPQPIVKVEGSRYVDVCVNRLDGKLMINLVNSSGPYADLKVYTYDEVTPVGPLEITLRTPKRPRALTLQPNNEVLPFTYSKGQVRFTLPCLELHEIIVVD